MTRILILASFDRSLVNFRGRLIRSLVEDGHEVFAAAPPETPGCPAEIEALGARYLPVEFDRVTAEFLGAIRLVGSIKRICLLNEIDVLFAYTMKPVICGCLGASAANVPRIVAVITGLGSAFHPRNRWQKVKLQLLTRLYRIALSRADLVIAQNEEICRYLKRLQIDTGTQIATVKSSGVDVQRYYEQPVHSGPPLFLFLGRLLRDKGLLEFVAAAKEVKRLDLEARFMVVGSTDKNPTSVTAGEISAWAAAGTIEHIPWVEDVRPYLGECAALVLPSYHEGFSRSILEAMSVGRPVITTDVAGCRDALVDIGICLGVDGQCRLAANGIMVPARSSYALAEAMYYLILHPAERASMGSYAARHVRERFSVEAVNRQIKDLVFPNATAQHPQPCVE